MKPFGQPVTEIFDFEEGSRFAALTVGSDEHSVPVFLIYIAQTHIVSSFWYLSIVQFKVTALFWDIIPESCCYGHCFII